MTNEVELQYACVKLYINVSLVV